MHLPTFDPYYRWLGISPKDQPPNYYRLLGVDLFEPSPDVIEAAADQRMAHVRAFQTGKHSAQSQRLLNELAAARVCLLNPARRAAYDEQLRQTLASQQPQAQPESEVAPAELEFLQREEAQTIEPAKPPSRSLTGLWVAVAAGTAFVLIAAILALLSSRSGGNATVAGRPNAHGPGDAAEQPERKKPTTDAKPPMLKPPPRTTADPNQGLKPEVPPPGTSLPPKALGPATATKTPLQDPKAPETKPTARDIAPEKPAAKREEVPEKKMDPPTPEEQKRLIQAIDEVYKPSQAKDKAAKVALAQKLLEEGRKSESNPAEQFALLRRSGEIARDAGAVELMLETVDAIADAGFNIQPYKVKSRCIQSLLEESPPGDVSELSDLSGTCVKFADEAAVGGAAAEASAVLRAAQDAWTEAKKRGQQGLRAARTAASRTRNLADKAAGQRNIQEAEEQVRNVDAAMAAVADCATRVQKVRQDRESVAAAQGTLKASPDNADACLTVGRWLCFHEGDWDAGLRLLAKGSDESLKSLAAEELASKPERAEDKIVRGDAWWDRAEKFAGWDKPGMRRRSGYWYQQAMGDLASGLARSRLEKRLMEVSKEPEIQPSGRAAPPLAIAPFDEKTAKLHQSRWAKYLRVPVVQTNSIGMKLVLIPPGEFEMGSPKELIEDELGKPSTDAWYRDRLQGEGPRHHVRITKPYRLGQTEVTQEEYERVMHSNPSKSQGDLKRPVEQITWEDAIEFCHRLSELPGEKAAKRQYQLPTEAQWEHACRAGNQGRWNFSPQSGQTPPALEERLFDAYGWFNGNAGGQTHPVGTKRPNAWALYDMHGNVWEWCRDWYDRDYYTKSVIDDPAGVPAGVFRVPRGGGWDFPSGVCRSALRDIAGTKYRWFNLGMRVCAEVGVAK